MIDYNRSIFYYIQFQIYTKNMNNIKAACYLIDTRRIQSFNNYFLNSSIALSKTVGYR